MQGRRPIRRGSARAFRPSRTATCTSATRSPSASISAWRATTAASATCASTTPTRRRKSRSTSTPSSTRCSGWASTGGQHLYYARDYFDFMYRAAEDLIEAGHAYVDSLSAEEMRALRGTLTEPGTQQPVPRPQRRREPGPLPPDARRQVPRRRARAAREDRHGLAQHQPARPGDLPHPPGAPPPHRRPVVHLPDVHLRAPDRGRAGEHHALALHAGVRGPAAVLRLAARAPRRRRPARSGRCRSRSSSRASTSPTSCSPSAS